RLDTAPTLQEVLTAAVVPRRLPPQEADESVRLRDEVSRLQTRCEDAERGLANEVQLRTATEADSVRSTEDFYTMHDANQDLCTENEELVRIRELDITVAEQAHGVQRLKDRCRSPMPTEREGMKAGLAVYNAELTKLRQYLEEHGRGKVCFPSPRMKALLAENASLHRANSVLLQKSAEHGLNTDAKAAPTAILSVARSDHKKAQPSAPTPASGLSLSKQSRTPPRPILEEGEVADDAGFDLGTEAPVGGASARSSPLSGVKVTATSGQSQSAVTDDVSSKSVVEVLDLTADDVTDFSSKDDLNPFSSPVVSYFPRQDGRPRRSTSVISELRMRENLERELADDDFMLGLTNEGSVAPTSSPPQGTVQAVVTPAGVAELPTEESVATEPLTASSSVEAQVPPESSSAETPGGGAAESVAPTISTPPLLFKVPRRSELDNESSAELSSAGLGVEGSVEPSTPVQPMVQPQQATEVSVRSSSRTRRGRGHVIQNEPRPRRPTRVITATVTARRGTDTSTFTPAAVVISRATTSRKLPANAERFLKPGFTAVGAQKAWCKMLNVRLSALKEHSPPLDFAFLALMHNVRSPRHPWWVLFDRMPNEPLTFSLGKFVKGIRASGLGGLVRMWRQLSGHCYEDNEKVDLCVALWERRHWVQVSSMDNAIEVFRKATDLNRTRNNRADLLRQQFDRLWDWCSNTNGGSGNLPTEVLLEPSYLQYSMEVLEWAPDTEDWSRELRVLDVEQPWRNCWIDAPAEHPYNTTYPPCNPSAPFFVPTSIPRQAVISGIVVDQSLADADLVAPWTNEVSVVSETAGSVPTGVVNEGSADAEIAPSAPAELAEALDEDSFSFVPAETAASGLSGASAESSATSADAVTPAHDVEDPPSDIVLAPFEMLVQIATSECLASE
ncbi:hypothetical protein PHMEG_00025487, partial [Phytophthora megakarya]